MTDFCKTVSLSRPFGTLGMIYSVTALRYACTVLLRFILFEAVIKKSVIGDRLMEKAIAEGLVIDKVGQKRTKTDKNGQSTAKKTNEFPSAFIKTVYETIKSNPKAKYSWLEDNLGVNERTIRRAVEELKKLGYINPKHSKMGGEWQLLK